MDMDRTLFDFDKTEQRAFRTSIENLGLPYTEQALRGFHKINKHLWQKYEKNELTRQEVQLIRYQLLFERYGWTADIAEANEIYKDILGSSIDLIDGAYELCHTLSETHTLYIITNGATNQRGRLQRAGIASCFADIFISDEIGFRKPQKEFFQYVLQKANIKNKRECLVVGDSPTSDIKGARNAKLDSCLLSEKEIFCGYTYRISKLKELPALLTE